MKRRLSFIVLSLFSFMIGTAQEIDEQKEVQEFIRSQEFNDALRVFNADQSAQVDEASSFAFSQDEAQREIRVSVVLKKNDRVSHVFQAMKVPYDKRESLGEEYFISIIEYTDFDVAKQTGIIRLYDGDAGQVLISEYEILNGEPVGDIDKDLHVCDKNKDKDVTFTECYKCMVGMCLADKKCRGACVIYETFRSSCSRGIKLSCRVISFFH